MAFHRDRQKESHAISVSIKFLSYLTIPFNLGGTPAFVPSVYLLRIFYHSYVSGFPTPAQLRIPPLKPHLLLAIHDSRILEQKLARRFTGVSLFNDFVREWNMRNSRSLEGLREGTV
jgi:hypothetical protein